MARKILLADDSVTAQNMGRRILSEAGYEVVTVNNGSAALKKVAELKPDVIILDVYMPGYSGLEVCQRIKDGPETAHIPVLLTVGKLEPFKSDEARKVRADAHLVKPFEASELLSVLTKLEDKIVPLAESKSRGSLARTPAERSATPAKGAKFGDSESGWKNRLTIPSGTPKPEEAENEPVSTTSFRDFSRGKDFKPAEPPPFAGPVLDTLPQDITADEIAAITAAAAVFGEPTELAATDLAEEIAAVEAAANAAPAETSTLPEESVPAVASAVMGFEAAAYEAPNYEAAALEAELQAQSAPEITAAEAVEESSSATPAPAACPEPETTSEVAAAPVDADVVAALESLAPMNGNGVGSISATGHFAENGAKSEDGPASLAMAAAHHGSFSGPRWIAEEVPVSEDESAFILEREMQKVYAALADTGDAGMSSAASSPESFVPSGNAYNPELTNAEISLPPVESLSSWATETKPEAEADPVASSVEEVAASVNAAFEAAASEIPCSETLADAHSTESNFATEPIAVAAVNEPVAELEPEPVSAVSEIAEAAGDTAGEAAVAESMEESAYAAAASVGSAFRSFNRPADAISKVVAAEEPTDSVAEGASAEGGGEREAELAAAWAHWRQIRESIDSPQSASPVAEHGADRAAPAISSESHYAQNSETPSAQAESSAPATSADSSTIASIVDTMLAELRPKLVEEIAKKMGKPK